MPQPPRTGYRDPVFLGALTMGALAVIASTAIYGFSPMGPIRPHVNPGNRELMIEIADLPFLVSAAIAGFVLFFKRRYRRRFFLSAGLYLSFLVMEETDWLQQVFHYQTPLFFLKYNTNEVTNFHNLDVLLRGTNETLSLLASTVVAVSPLLGYFVYSIRRAYYGDFLGKVVLIFLAFAIATDFIPRHSVLQPLFGLFTLAYLLIVDRVARLEEMARQ